MGYLITLVVSASSWLLKQEVRRKVPAETVARFGRALGLTPHRTNYHLARLIPPVLYGRASPDPTPASGQRLERATLPLRTQLVRVWQQHEEN